MSSRTLFLPPVRYHFYLNIEVLASKRLFQEILERIHRLKPAGKVIDSSNFFFH